MKREALFSMWGANPKKGWKLGWCGQAWVMWFSRFWKLLFPLASANPFQPLSNPQPTHGELVHPWRDVSPFSCRFFYISKLSFVILDRRFWQGTYAPVLCNIFLSFWINGFGGQELCSDSMCGWILSWAFEVAGGVHFLASLWLSLAFEGELYLGRVRFKSLFAWMSYCLFVLDILKVHFYFV